LPGFSPLLGAYPRVLVLGSMPSQKSLAEGRYYAHPQNAFWWIVSQIAGFDDTLPYAAKCDKLVSARIAVWDVLYDCVRPGSLDSDIQRTSEQPNDVEGLLVNNPSIGLIAFNGTAAKKIFMRHCGNTLEQFPHIQHIQLPSTSPAHARITRQQKLTLWRDVIEPVLSGTVHTNG